MNALAIHAPTHSPIYQQVLDAGSRVRWEIDRDVLRGRALRREEKFLPDGLSLAPTLGFLTDPERRFFSQVQGRTYANIFGLVERFINAKVIELSRQYLFSDQVALESLVRFSQEELKHQELFRRVEVLAAQVMPAGYSFSHDPDQVAQVMLARSTWAVLALTCHIELFTLAHFKQSIEGDEGLSPLWKDVFRFHWKEESQHALLDEVEWRQADAGISDGQRDLAVDDFLELVAAVDGLLQAQAAADAGYFLAALARPLAADERDAVGATFLRAYRYQYLRSGLELTRFPAILFELVSPAQRARIEAAIAPLL
jgi:hypothetical protein